MRTDVKLGVVIALATVLVAGGYYMDGDSDQKPVEMKGKSLADVATPSARPTSRAGNTAGRATSHTAAKQHSTRGSQGKTSPVRSPRNSVAQRKPVAKPGVSMPPKGVPSRASQLNKKRLAQATASPAATRKPSGASAATHPVKPTPTLTGSGATSAARSRPGVSGPTSAGHRQEGGSVAANGPAHRSGVPDGRHGGATNAVQQKSGTRAGAKPVDAAHGGRPSGQVARGVHRPGPHGPAPGIAVAKSAKTPPARATRSDNRGVAVDLHRVQPGDSLAALAKMYYGHEKYVPFLLKSNPKISDPRRLALGTEVRIPPLPTAGPERRPTSAHVRKASTRDSTDGRASARSYTVKAGDTFYGIARSQLGDAGRWRALYELNASLVGDDPSRLKIGQVLKLPPK